MNSATLFSDDLVQAVSVQEHHGGDREPGMRCGDVFLATAALGVCGVSSRLCSICDRAMSNPVRFRSGPATVRHPPCGAARHFARFLPNRPSGEGT